MTHPYKIGSRKLFWRFSLFLILIFSALAVGYVISSVRTAQVYYSEANQRINRDLGQHIAADISHHYHDKITDSTLRNMFRDIMVLNPSIEVYLLDSTGNIVGFSAAPNEVVLEKVNLNPVTNFLEAGGHGFFLGQDPKQPSTTKTFSAATIPGYPGYVYVILTGKEFQNNAKNLLSSYIIRLTTRTTLLTILAALIISLIAVWYLTKNLNRIVDAVIKFQNGDLSARINVKSKSELGLIANTFNNMADKIKHHIEEIKSVDELRKELIANISHDIRTPISIIKGYAETLFIKNENLDKIEKKKYAEIVLQSAHKLKRLVDELFELSKLENGQIQLQPEPFAVKELIFDNAQKYTMAAEEKGIAIQVEMSDDLPLVHADIELVDRVIQNLLDNALKFTPNKGEITLIAVQELENKVCIKVADSGMGIPENQLPFIFDRYNKGDHEKNMANNGVGLGLAIVKKIIDLHGGAISVSSKINDGTIFSFDLPIYKVAEKETSPEVIAAKT